jgi:hypothetical protein
MVTEYAWNKHKSIYVFIALRWQPSTIFYMLEYFSYLSILHIFLLHKISRSRVFHIVCVYLLPRYFSYKISVYKVSLKYDNYFNLSGKFLTSSFLFYKITRRQICPAPNIFSNMIIFLSS